MSKFINPFSDYGFKAIFGSEVSKDLIISFLNGVLHDEVIKDISFRNVEMLGVRHGDRKAVFDIFYENEKGEFFIVEMQKSRQKYFTDRVLYYASFAIQQQSQIAVERTKLSEERFSHLWRYDINKVYVVCILNFIMDPSRPEKYRWDVVRMDRELREPFSETLNEIYLEMPKFCLPLSSCDTIYKKWLYVLNNIDIMERLPKELNNQIFQKLKSIVEIERMTPDERLAYELSLSAERDISAIAETRYEEGKEEGLKEGKEEGLKEGQKRIIEQMKNRGMSIDEISECTGYPIDEITRLLKKQ